jgi:K+-dependent Na+/Ca+ exchanger-like protein
MGLFKINAAQHQRQKTAVKAAFGCAAIAFVPMMIGVATKWTIGPLGASDAPQETWSQPNNIRAHSHSHRRRLAESELVEGRGQLAWPGVTKVGASGTALTHAQQWKETKPIIFENGYTEMYVDIKVAAAATKLVDCKSIACSVGKWATCGDGVDASGAPCALNTDETACKVTTGTCTYAANADNGGTCRDKVGACGDDCSVITSTTDLEPVTKEQVEQGESDQCRMDHAQRFFSDLTEYELEKELKVALCPDTLADCELAINHYNGAGVNPCNDANLQTCGEADKLIDITVKITFDGGVTTIAAQEALDAALANPGTSGYEAGRIPLAFMGPQTDVPTCVGADDGAGAACALKTDGSACKVPGTCAYTAQQRARIISASFYGPCCSHTSYKDPLNAASAAVAEPKYCNCEEKKGGTCAISTDFTCKYGHAVGTCLVANEKSGAHEGKPEDFMKFNDIDAKSFEDAGLCCENPNADLDIGLLILRILGIVYLFMGIALVCDDFFTASLEKLSIRFELSEDVAGATFMAAGSSAPELFTSLSASMFSEGVSCDNAAAVGVGTIVGSAIFNILIIIGATAMLAGSVLQLSYKPLVRDTCFYAGSIGLIFICLLEEPDAGEGNALVTWWEALILVSGYVAYIVFMKFNEKICGTTSDTVKEEEPTERVRRNSVPVAEGETDVEAPAKEQKKEGFDKYDKDGDGTITREEFEKVQEEDKAAAEEEEEGNECWGMEVPDGCLGKGYAYFTFPWFAAFKITIPDCEEERWGNWYVVSFIMSIVWIGLICHFMVVLAIGVGEQLSISSSVMGLTVLSAGTSVPDALSSIMVAQRGLGDMAVSNALGSNVFDILLGLGIPYFLSNIKSMAEGCSNDITSTLQECAVRMCVKDVTVFMICLVIVLFGVIGSFAIFRFRLHPGLGVVLLVMYVVFAVFAYLRDQGVIDTGPTCSGGGH